MKAKVKLLGLALGLDKISAAAGLFGAWKAILKAAPPEFAKVEIAPQ